MDELARLRARVREATVPTPPPQQPPVVTVHRGYSAKTETGTWGYVVGKGWGYSGGKWDKKVAGGK